MWYICDFFYFALFSYVILPLLWAFFWLSYVLEHSIFQEEVRVAQEFYYNVL